MTQQEYKEFVKSTLDEIGSLIARKNSDYSDGGDAFANVRLAEREADIPTEKGIYVRLSDKFKRLSNGIKGQEFKVNDETMKDTIHDLIGYSLLLLGYMKSKEQLAVPREEKFQKAIVDVNKKYGPLLEKLSKEESGLLSQLNHPVSIEKELKRIEEEQDENFINASKKNGW